MDPFLRIIIDITEGFEFVRGCFEILQNILNKIVFRPDSPLMNRSQTVRPLKSLDINGKTITDTKKKIKLDLFAFFA